MPRCRCRHRRSHAVGRPPRGRPHRRVWAHERERRGVCSRELCLESLCPLFHSVKYLFRGWGHNGPTLPSSPRRFDAAPGVRATRVGDGCFDADVDVPLPGDCRHGWGKMKRNTLVFVRHVGDRPREGGREGGGLLSQRSCAFDQRLRCPTWSGKLCGRAGVVWGLGGANDVC